MSNTTDNDAHAQVLAMMYLLYEHGIQEVHMGGLMRIMGIDNEVAADFDDKVMVLTDDFAKYVREIQSGRDLSQPLH
jgi:hypothetical protein